jgi:hypothetical protein
MEDASKNVFQESLEDKIHEMPTVNTQEPIQAASDPLQSAQNPSPTIDPIIETSLVRKLDLRIPTLTGFLCADTFHLSPILIC